MNPMIQELLASFVRHGLQFVAGYLVARGIWTNEQALMYIPPLALAIVAYGWNWYEKWMHRQKLNTALASSTPMTENQVTAMVKDQDINTPPASVSKDRIPYIGAKSAGAYPEDKKP